MLINLSIQDYAVVDQLEVETDHYVQKYIVRALVSLTKQTFPVNPRIWRAWWERSRVEFLEGSDIEPEEDPAIPRPSLRELIKKKLTDDDDGIATTNLKVTVSCPLGKH